MVSFFEFKLEGRRMESLDVEDPGFEGLGSTWPSLVISGNSIALLEPLVF